MTLEELKTKKIAILGLGVNNKKLAEYLKSHGLAFTIFENWSALSELTGKIDNFDVVFRTPGLPYLSQAIQQAQKKGVLIYSQTKLFFDLCPCPIVGVTGTKGKGTTATLLSKFLEAAGRSVYLAGNIGEDPFSFLDKLKPSDLVVLELSSFQLQDLHRSPHVAVVLKITSEHLDHHSNTAEYREAKKPILRFQRPDDFAVLNHDQQKLSKDLASLTKAQIVWNSLLQKVKPGCFVKDDKIYLWSRGREQEVAPVSEVKLLGRFNLENVTAAIAAATALGVEETAVFQRIVSRFQGLPHRLEHVADKQGVKFYNDSFATTPETTIAAMSAFAEPLVLIVGGSEKKSDYRDLAKHIAAANVKVLVPIGLTGLRIAELAGKRGFTGEILAGDFGDMGKIVKQAKAAAEPGDVVLLSPASASFDMFANYKHRGELFKKFVNRL